MTTRYFVDGAGAYLGAVDLSAGIAAADARLAEARAAAVAVAAQLAASAEDDKPTVEALLEAANEAVASAAAAADLARVAPFPAGSIEVPSPPEDARQVWSGSAWGP